MYFVWNMFCVVSDKSCHASVHLLTSVVRELHSFCVWCVMPHPLVCILWDVFDFVSDALCHIMLVCIKYFDVCVMCLVLCQMCRATFPGPLMTGCTLGVVCPSWRKWRPWWGIHINRGSVCLHALLPFSLCLCLFLIPFFSVFFTFCDCLS